MQMSKEQNELLQLLLLLLLLFVKGKDDTPSYSKTSCCCYCKAYLLYFAPCKVANQTLCKLRIEPAKTGIKIITNHQCLTLINLRLI